MKQKSLILKNVRVHNLRSVDLELPHNQLIVFTGVSGSGKSSLAFDTIYVEGQRRYVESLSTFARRYLGDMAKPDVEKVEGLSPTISVEQKTAGNNPRSTVGTLTEIYDYLRVLFARVGTPHCPISGERVAPQSKERIIKSVSAMAPDQKIMLLAPYARQKKGEFVSDFEDLLRQGYMRARVDGEVVNLSDGLELDGSLSHDVDVVIDRLVTGEQNASRIAESITLALEVGQGVCRVVNVTSDEEALYSMHAYSEASGESYEALDPNNFSFNSPSGMCSECQGLGRVTSFDLDKVIDPDKSIATGCCQIASSYDTVKFGNIYKNLARIYDFRLTTPWRRLSDEAKHVFLYGTEKKWTRMTFTHPTKGTRWQEYVAWRGVIDEAKKRYAEAKSKHYRGNMEKLMIEQECPSCHGGRLKAYPAATTVGDKRIREVAHLTVQECSTFFTDLNLAGTQLEIGGELLKEIRQRLTFLLDVGLHYLTLDRTAPTLSGGEAQRVRLASQIGCGLVGVTYILDEPSIGLHPRDNRKLIETLQSLRDRGNTVIVVEHDEETMWAADRIVDFGPGPGHRGGEILVNGTLKQLLKNKRSITGAFLRRDRTIAVPKNRRKKGKESLTVQGATHHNLKGVTAKIPLGLFVAVTGVSGSGKSSLISDILHPELMNRLHKGEQKVGAHKALLGVEHLDKVIGIDQSAIGRNPRSNPSTYIKVFDDIRDLFTQLPESRARGYKSGRFSFNVREGSCLRCHGMGQMKIDMDFMEAAWVDCPVCRTRRFDSETLSVMYKGKNIYDVLEMEVHEALKFFENIPPLKRKLETLAAVGMDYIRLGQPSTTLSGGEAQRIKLAKELIRPATGRTLYILDEPTTGLHFHDIQHLLNVLHKLVDRGNTVLVIEHNMDVVKTADWILDLGPEGGEGGGQLIAEGTPEKIAKMDTPSGQAIRDAIAQITPDIERTPRKAARELKSITVTEAEQNNLRGVTAEIPRGKMTICCGPSGSGKTSLALDTIYAEGQRRYIESLSPYARQFVKQMPKPKVGHVDGLSAAVAIEQKAHAGNPRSTVGTMTEIYDYLRVLYARVGTAHCPDTGEVIKAISKEHVVDRLLGYPDGERICVLAPLEMKKSESFESVVDRYRRQGYLRIRLNKEIHRLDEEIPFDRKRKNVLELVVDRIKIDPTVGARLFEAVEGASEIAGGKLDVLRQDGKTVPFNLSFSVESTGKSYPEITPHTFAFNTPAGMCMECQGIGSQFGANIMENPDLMALRISRLFELLWGEHMTNEAYSVLQDFLHEENLDLEMRLRDIPKRKLPLFMNGSPEGRLYRAEPDGYRFSWPGVNTVLARLGRAAKKRVKEGLKPILSESSCSSCEGDRINPLARKVTISDTSLPALCRMPMEEVVPFIKGLDLKGDRRLLDEVQSQLLSRLNFLVEVGLGYLSLERKAPSLSGGEAQRIRLARQLGSGLTGVLYVLDEPTIGLHPRDNDRLNNALQQLKALGNTLLMVEHDPLTVRQADYLLDFGPGAGHHGGEITARGTIKQIEKDPASLTGRYLSGKMETLSRIGRKPGKPIKIKNASKHNLKGINVEIPTQSLVCITGVSGSGKSTLIHEVLRPAVQQGLGKRQITIDGCTVSGLSDLDRLIVINQAPIGTTVRATVGTYIDIVTPMRHLFAQTADGRARGLEPRHFSPNHRRGMCTHCWGLGYRRVQMHFMPMVKVACEECKGLRLNPVSLEVKYAGKNLGEYFRYTVEEIVETFSNIPAIRKLCNTLISVGLGYLTLGQEMQSLSGGEAQRLKLSRELAKRSTGNTLYLLDEPTTGLHPDDIQKLLAVLQGLVDKGNSMVVIEHNLDLIRAADWLLDIGPEAGDRGGELVCSGTPEQVAKSKTSHTGRFLANENAP